MPALDLSTDVVALAAAIIDVPSQSHDEAELADLVESALADCAHLNLLRLGNTIVARTELGRSDRVLIGGHLDTVPSAGRLQHRFEGDRLYGLGACDMKGGLAIALALAANVSEPVRDVTYVFYECEEVASQFNGLQKVVNARPELLNASLAILMEPSNAGIEAGCQGTLRAEIRLSGIRSHSARSWMGVNAVHAAGEVLARLQNYQAREPDVDGLRFHEGLNAVGIKGGIAGNVIPDECVVTVNYRFAPDRSLDEAKGHVESVFEGFDVQFVDEADAARPGLDLPAAAAFVDAIGVTPQPKYGWTDVARFTALGTPALNFGPGDPSIAHAVDEWVSVAQLRSCHERLLRWLTA
ncbi:MAG: succinyl-diaminopimelate desuccinylase [Actinomycetota bacterium]|nr:succinyl-diaminopimelate desuccinylase [Actinomycetota bacterium]